MPLLFLTAHHYIANDNHRSISVLCVGVDGVRLVVVVLLAALSFAHFREHIRFVSVSPSITSFVTLTLNSV